MHKIAELQYDLAYISTATIDSTVKETKTRCDSIFICKYIF